MKLETISKQDAIRRQLDTAIWLWFQDDDSISIHTLGCCALKVADDVGKEFGKRAMLFEFLPKELKKDAIAAQGFFKHAKDDAHDVLSFNPEITPYHMYDAANCYKSLYSSLTPLMTTFILRFLLLNPTIGSVDLPLSLSAFAKSDLAAMTNDKFFDSVLPILNRSSRIWGLILVRRRRDVAFSEESKRSEQRRVRSGRDGIDEAQW